MGTLLLACQILRTLCEYICCPGHPLDVEHIILISKRTSPTQDANYECWGVQAGAVVALEVLLAAAASAFVKGLTSAPKQQAAKRGAKLKT